MALPGTYCRVAPRGRTGTERSQVSVRRLYPGPHRVEVQVNGRVLGGVDVELFRPDDSG